LYHLQPGKVYSQAIEGFFRATDYIPIEIIIHDDASTDRTGNYQGIRAKSYPELIVPIYQTENQYSKGQENTVNFVLPS